MQGVFEGTSLVGHVQKLDDPLLNSPPPVYVNWPNSVMTPPILEPAIGVVVTLNGECGFDGLSRDSVTERLSPGSIHAPCKPFGAAESGAGKFHSSRFTFMTPIAIVTDEEFFRTIFSDSPPAAPRFAESEPSSRESPNAFRAKLPAITSATTTSVTTTPNQG